MLQLSDWSAKDDDVQRIHSQHSFVSQQLPYQQSGLWYLSILLKSTLNSCISAGWTGICFKWSTRFLWQHHLINHTQKPDAVFHLKTAVSATATNNMNSYEHELTVGFGKMKVQNIFFQNNFQIVKQALFFFMATVKESVCAVWLFFSLVLCRFMIQSVLLHIRVICWQHEKRCFCVTLSDIPFNTSWCRCVSIYVRSRSSYC